MLRTCGPIRRQSARAKLAAGHRLIWYDRLGCGLSDRDGFTPSVANDVDQLVAVLQAANVERCSLIGYSMGGPPAAEFAARFPERVDRLVLYSTYARGSGLSSEVQHESMKALIRSNWALGALTLAAMFIPNGSRRDLNWFSRFQRDAAHSRDGGRSVRCGEHARCPPSADGGPGADPRPDEPP